MAGFVNLYSINCNTFHNHTIHAGYSTMQEHMLAYKVHSALRLLAHFLEQYLTIAQTFCHFLRHANGR